MFAVVLRSKLLPISMKFPPGTIIRRYAKSWDSLMPFNWRELTVEYSRCLSLRIASTAATSLTDVPGPLYKRIGGTAVDAVGAQAVVASGMRNRSRATAVTLRAWAANE